MMEKPHQTIIKEAEVVIDEGRRQKRALAREIREEK